MELVGVLKTTGGTPGVRRHLFRFLDSMKIPHDHSIYTARAVFAIIEASLEENTGSDMINLYEPLQDIVDGKVRSLRSVKHLQNSVLSLMGELNDGKKPLALASAVISPILDEGDTYSLLPLDESELYSIVSEYDYGLYSLFSEYDDDLYYLPPLDDASVEGGEPTDKASVEDTATRRPFFKQMGIILAVLCTLAISLPPTGSTFNRIGSRATIGARVSESMQRIQATAFDFLAPKQPSYDKPRRLEDPDTMIVPPSPSTHKSLSNQKIRSTAYHGNTHRHVFSPNILPQSVDMIACPAGVSDLQVCLDAIADKYKDNLQHGRVVKTRDEYVLISGRIDKEFNDAQDEEIVLWIEHMLRSVDPVYLQNMSQLKVYLSARGVHDKAPGTGGFYRALYDNIWIKTQLVRGGGPISMAERRTNLKVIVHEMAHRVHLATEYIATDCGSHICKNLQYRYDGLSDLELGEIKDEVDAVLYLGYESEDITYEDAVLLNKKILDMRIEHLFSIAGDSQQYQDLPGSQYWAKNYVEFWAESSLSFLIANSGGLFPDRDWIEKNDPRLFSLLDEVWAGAKYASFDEVRTLVRSRGKIKE